MRNCRQIRVQSYDVTMQPICVAITFFQKKVFFTLKLASVEERFFDEDEKGNEKCEWSEEKML